MFDPTLYQFTPDHHFTDRLVWSTYPDERIGAVGSYIITYNKDEDIWKIEELVLVNKKERFIPLYYGRIPNEDFGHQLMINMELDIPVIQREVKINMLNG